MIPADRPTAARRLGASSADTHHDHRFGQHETKAGEGSTWIVVVLTAATMVVEVGAGILFGSMALLADGLHMASHTAALGLSAVAYLSARRLAADRRYSFGTGKINILAGFTSAVTLSLFALLMAGESIRRFFQPVPIRFDEAIGVAVLGLIVNGVSVVLLGKADHDGEGGHHDHNLKAAYLHVLADALTSVLAIVALLAAKYFGAVWMDPFMGIVGGTLVARWAWRLLGETASVLLDRQAPEAVLDEVRAAIEADGRSVVTDLHVWAIGPGYRAAAIAVATLDHRGPDHFVALLPEEARIAHATVEVRRPAG